MRDFSIAAARYLLLSLFFLSGFSALLYQVVWQRMMALFSGVDIFSVTVIVASFMAGLGCGAMAGGFIADRASRRQRVLLFAAAELAVAGFALISPWLYYDQLYGTWSGLAGSPALLPVVLFAALFWPTFFMGVSLPLLATAITRDLDKAPDRVGALYGVNTLGAATGAVVTVWILARQLGFVSSLHVGVGLNALCAVGALAALPLLGRNAESPGGDSAPDGLLRERTRFPFGAWVLLYGLSGFVALSLEIVWFRLLGVMIKSSSFTFGSLLGIYLLGFGIGTLAGLPLARRAHHPARTFLALQAAIPVYAAVSVALLVAGVQEGDWLGSLSEHLARYHPLDPRLLWEGGARGARLWTLYGVLPAALVIPPTLCMGLSFPLLQRVVQTDLAFVGRRVGWLQAANIGGSALGAVGVGWLLLGVWGTSGTLRFLALLSCVFALAWFRTAASEPTSLRRAAPAVALVLALVAAGVIPDGARLWAALHGTQPDRILHGEDGSGVSVLRAETPSFSRVTVFVNGRGQSWVPYGDVHSLLGILSVFVHPNPQDVAVIGLGSGDTLFSVAGREVTRSVTCWELIEPQLDTLERLYQRGPYPGLASVLHDPRIDIRFGDGRAALLRSDTRYDVIEADALRPMSAYAGNLYSLEFFSLLRDRLKPGGLVVSWAPTKRIRRTFIQAFPHVWLAKEFVVGSNQTIAMDADAIRERARSPHARAWYDAADIDLSVVISKILGWRWNEVGPDFDRSDLVDVNTDLYPRDEYGVAEGK